MVSALIIWTRKFENITRRRHTGDEQNGGGHGAPPLILFTRDTEHARPTYHSTRKAEHRPIITAGAAVGAHEAHLSNIALERIHQILPADDRLTGERPKEVGRAYFVHIDEAIVDERLVHVL